MFEDIETKIKKHNIILFSRQSACLQPLLSQISHQSHQTLILWALDCAMIPIQVLEQKYPFEMRPRRMVELCDAWAKGLVKMPLAKQAILAVHAAAKSYHDEIDQALCHAIGQAGATVHVETHAIGLVFYELTALVFQKGKTDYQVAIIEKLKYYEEKLLYWQHHTAQCARTWATFIADDARFNRESRLLNKKN